VSSPESGDERWQRYVVEHLSVVSPPKIDERGKQLLVEQLSKMTERVCLASER